MFKRHFYDKVFYKKLLQLTIPAALQSLMLAAVAAADAFMLGKLEQNYMSAVSLASQIQFVQNLILSAATSSASLLGAQYWGIKNKNAIRSLFHIILKCCSAVSFVFFLSCEFHSVFLMKIFTNDHLLIEIGSSYLKIAGWSYLFTGVSQCYLAIFKVTGHADKTAIISSGAVIINILLNALLIFGFRFIPGLNVKGAAIATLTARVAELLFCLLLPRNDGYVFPSFKTLFQTDKILRKDFIQNMLPLLGASLFWGVGFTSYSAFMGHLGQAAAAANSVTSVVRDLICCLNTGIAIGGGIVVGNELGADKLELGKLYGNRLGSLSFLCGFLSTFLMLLFIPIVKSFIRLSPEASEYYIQMMIIMSVYMIGRCVNTVIINGVFYSGGDTMFDFYSLAVCMWGIAIPLAALGTFVFHWPVWIVYSCTCLDEVGKIPWVLAHFKKYKWVRKLTNDNVK